MDGLFRIEGSSRRSACGRGSRCWSLWTDGNIWSGREGLLEPDADLSPVLADPALIREILGIFSRHSLYAFEDEIRQGFLTIEGGHRVGIAGKAVTEGSGLRTIRDISSLNIRLAHEKPGCGDPVLPWLYENGRLQNTLILSPPGAGKTTL